MLSQNAMERISEKLTSRIEQLNYYMINKIGHQLKEMETLTPSQLREIFQSVKYGNNLNEIITKINELTGINEKEIYSIFEEVAKKNQVYAKQFYDYRNVSFIPYEENNQLKSLVKAISKATADTFTNISKTSAYAVLNSAGMVEYTSLSETYQRIVDEGAIALETGRESYSSYMRKAMRTLTKKGMINIDYVSGYKRRTDSSLRMNILDSIRELDNAIEEELGEEFESDGVEVIHHKNPAPDHSSKGQIGWFDIDGNQFALLDKIRNRIMRGTEKNIKYSDIDDLNHRVRIKNKWYYDFNWVNDNLNRQVGQLNCYHTKRFIVCGINTPTYDKSVLETDKKANLEGFDYEGNHYTNYEGTQLQRKIESRIRRLKDRQIGSKAIDDKEDVSYCQEQIRLLTEKYNELSKVSGLPTRVDRLRVEGYKA